MTDIRATCTASVAALAVVVTVAAVLAPVAITLAVAIDVHTGLAWRRYERRRARWLDASGAWP